MTISSTPPDSIEDEYYCQKPLDLYNSPTCQELATQAATGRHLKLLPNPSHQDAIQILLVEDGYLAWLATADLPKLDKTDSPYQPTIFSRAQIEQHIPQVLDFVQTAMQHPNYYLWGGTIGPNYDCSGLMQTAYAGSGIWLPRDSYQQEAFVEKLELERLLPGDLVFFGSKRVDHVALYLGEGRYCHSSGKETGRNGIGIDQLFGKGDEISRYYWQKFWSCGRVMSSFLPPSFTDSSPL